MRFVKGNRRIPQERIYGFVLVTEVRAGVRTFGFIFGTRIWGVQWKLKKNESASSSR